MKPSACSMIKKNTNTGIRFWISALNYTLLGANGPLSLNLSVLINKMGRKANVQGYCNDHKCVRGEAEWRVSASWHSFSLGRWIKFWRWRVAMLHNKVNALKVMELNAPKWLKWYISFCIFYHNFLKRYVKILAQCLALSRCSGNASLIPLIKFFNLKKWQYRKSNKIMLLSLFNCERLWLSGKASWHQYRERHSERLGRRREAAWIIIPQACSVPRPPQTLVRHLPEHQS